MSHVRHLYGMTPDLMKYMEIISFASRQMRETGMIAQYSRTYAFPEGNIEYSFNGTIEKFIGSSSAVSTTPSKPGYVYFVLTVSLLYEVDYFTSEDCNPLKAFAVVKFKISGEDVTLQGITLYDYDDYVAWAEAITEDEIASSNMFSDAMSIDLGNSDYQGRITEMRLINEVPGDYWKHGIITPCEIHITHHPDLYPGGILTADSAYNVFEAGAKYTCYDQVVVLNYSEACPSHPPPGDVLPHEITSHVGDFGWEMPMCAPGQFDPGTYWNNFPKSYLLNVLLPGADPYAAFRVHRKADIHTDNVYQDCPYDLHSQWITNARTGTYVDKIYSPFGLMKEYVTTFQGQELFQGYLYAWTEGIQGIHGWRIVYPACEEGDVWTASSEKYDEYRLERVMNASLTHTITADEAFYYNRPWASHDYDAKYTNFHMASVFMWQFCPISQTANGFAGNPETYVTLSRSAREVYLHAQLSERAKDWIGAGRTTIVEDSLKDAIDQLYSALGMDNEVREITFDILFTDK